jgi:hypothetical protein
MLGFLLSTQPTGDAIALKSMPVDWSEIQSIDQMREKLKILENGIQNKQ